MKEAFIRQVRTQIWERCSGSIEAAAGGWACRKAIPVRIPTLARSSSYRQVQDSSSRGLGCSGSDASTHRTTCATPFAIDAERSPVPRRFRACFAVRYKAKGVRLCHQSFPRSTRYSSPPHGLPCTHGMGQPLSMLDMILLPFPSLVPLLSPLPLRAASLHVVEWRPPARNLRKHAPGNESLGPE